jgi:cytochrome c
MIEKCFIPGEEVMRRISLFLSIIVMLSACSGAPAATTTSSIPVTSIAIPAIASTPALLPADTPTLAPTEASTESPTEVPADLPTESLTDAPTATPTETLTATLLPEPTIADTPVAVTTIVTGDSPTGDVARGAELFAHGLNGAPPCSTCHLTQEGQTGFSLGPNLAYIGERAGARVEGEDIDAYLHQSILEPNAFLVPGYRSIMYPEYGKHYSDQEIEDLIAFLKSL